MQDISGSFRISGPNLEVDHVLIPRSGWIMGRTANNDLVLAHTQISRQHMRLFWQSGGFWVEDLGSTNGVWLNETHLEAYTPVELQEGDVIAAGPYTLIYDGVMGGNGVPQTQLSPIYPEENHIPPPGVIEMPPVTVRPRSSPTPGFLADAIVPRVRVRNNLYLENLPKDRSNWLQYLPAIYSESSLDPTHFIGRYLLIFESVLSPTVWTIDNFDLYLSPETAPPEWMQWIASWFDITIFAELPVENQRGIMRQIGWLYLRRGTKAGLERMLELVFGIKPEIIEHTDQICHFAVRLALSQSTTGLGEQIAEQIIESQKPAFATYTLEIN